MPNEVVVYRRHVSESAKVLAGALGGRVVRNLARVHMPNLAVCVPWGEHPASTALRFRRVLSNGPVRTKLTDARMLAEAGVPTITVSSSLQRPDAVVGRRFAVELAGGILDRPAAEALVRRIMADLALPDADPEEWIGRRQAHVGGLDLLRPPGRPDFYVRREHFAKEFRVHSFRGRSIRAGIKIPREGLTPHPWIRSWDGGWRISYDGRSAQERHREIAHRAVAALGLQYGAVDIGERADGTLCILEVNRAPGIEGGTLTAYAEAFRSWLAEA